MPSSDYLPFATGGSANVESQGSYAGSSIQVNGFQTGLAPSNAMNKAIRQSSMMSAAIAQFLVNQLGINIPDDGNLSNLITNFKNAIWASAGLTGVPTAPTQASSDNSTRVANTAFSQNAIAVAIAALVAGFSIGPGVITFPAFLGGLIIQYGNVALAAGVQTLPFNIDFPTACLFIISCDGGSTPHATAAEIVDNTQFNASGMFFTGGGWNYAITNYSWMAVGN